MENEIIQIVCQVCGTVLKVRRQEGIENKYVTCPVCKKRDIFTAYKEIAADEETSTDITRVSSDKNNTIGVVRITGTDITFQLKKGVNVIGRKGVTSKADIQIPCRDLIMSREHLVIDVQDNPQFGIRHLVSLFKKEVGDTYIGENRLCYGDVLLLEPGTTIQLPEVELVFENPA